MTAGGGIEGRCHCGRATVRLPHVPSKIVQCNCSLCTKTGFRGVYSSSDEVEIVGTFDSYVREDLQQPYLTTHRCTHCGTVTHWTPLTEPPHERMGVNARLFDPAILGEVPVDAVDGASWEE